MSLEVPSFLKTEADSACSISISASDGEDAVKYGFDSSACDITLVDPSDNNTKLAEEAERPLLKEKEKGEDTEHILPISTADIIKKLGFSRTEIINLDISLLDETLISQLVGGDDFFIFTDDLSDTDKDVLFIVSFNPGGVEEAHMCNNSKIHLEIQERNEATTDSNGPLGNQEVTKHNSKLKRPRANNQALDDSDRNNPEPEAKRSTKISETQRALEMNCSRSLDSVQDSAAGQPNDSHSQDPNLGEAFHPFQNIFRPNFGIGRIRTQKIARSNSKNLTSSSTGIRRSTRNNADGFNTPCKIQ